MVYWITGRANSGKTTLAHKIAAQINGVVLDGDDIRRVFPAGYDRKDRRAHQLRLMKLARVLHGHGVNVVVACVSPDKKYRRLLQKLLKECVEIQLPFGELWEGTEYEE